MKVKIIILVLLLGGAGAGGYYAYNHYYVKTLMLSEIVGHTDNDLVNILVNLADFDTGLTRHDLHNLKSDGDYWIRRMNEVNSISDPDARDQANIKLLADMMEDPTMKKVVKLITAAGLEVAVKVLETTLS